MKLHIYFAEYRARPYSAEVGEPNTVSHGDYALGNRINYREALPAGSRYPAACRVENHGPIAAPVQTILLVPDDQRLEAYRDEVATIISLDSVRAYDPTRRQWVSLNIRHGGEPAGTIERDLPADPSQWVSANGLQGVARLIAYGSARGHLTTLQDAQLKELFGE